MKPYLYILILLLTGGTIGFFVGRDSNSVKDLVPETQKSVVTDTDSIRKIFERQKEAYRLHDALLLLRDCSDVFLEMDSNTGQVFDLSRSLIYYHEQFKPRKSIRFEMQDLNIKIEKNLAVVQSKYTKTSAMYRDLGYERSVGKGLWLLTKNGDRWLLNAFSRTENFE